MNLQIYAVEPPPDSDPSSGATWHVRDDQTLYYGHDFELAVARYMATGGQLTSLQRLELFEEGQRLHRRHA